ncbi:unnamed protein product [Schistosoma curassoni]|uniref:C2H2-type domain-containing protein n=1 Tax=Schistosoma curassoni TaxID=6186 RepID=A0A183K097_9TREM|nr:unnamed protein product [Schistosoma curassoni]
MSIMKDFELDKYSNALVSHRKSLIKSDYKTTTHCNNEKRLNYPLTDFEHWDKFSRTGNSSNSNNNNNNNNGDSKSLSHIKLPERHVFTASTASLIVHVPSLSYVSEDIDDDLSDHEISKLNLNLNNNNNNKNHNRICPICNTIYIDLQQHLSLHYSTFSSITHNNNNNISSTLTNSLSLPCLSNFDEQLTMISTRSNENTILHSNNNNNNNVIYNRNINNTPSISIEYADNISITTNNSQEQIINNQLSGETKSKCELWLKTC